ncbi:MAG: hypothetical protein L6Q99_09775 [Planctomycetes bacterium]|nr:hypothetical protein [Planctomycetota bacterium]
MRHPYLRFALPAATPFVLAAVATAQFTEPPAITFVSDPELDTIFILHDDNPANGNFWDPNEVVPLYVDTVGSVPLSEPWCLTASSDDTLYVGDHVEDVVLWLNDFDEDDDASVPGQHGVFFDGKPGGNLSGVVMGHVNSITMQPNVPNNVVWLVTSNTQAGEDDAVIRLEDLDSDGDANDVGEARVFYTRVESSLSDSELTSIRLDGTGTVYVLENGSTGAWTRGIWALRDLDSSGAIDAPGEESLFFAPPALPATPELSSLDRDSNARFYVLDRANHVVWRGADLDSSGAIDPGEAAQHWSFANSIDAWDFAVLGTGEVYLGNSTGPDQLFITLDTDLNGTIGAGESFNAYDDTQAVTNLEAVRGVALDFHAHGHIGTVVCDAFSNPCPCGNQGTKTSGCTNSTGAGAELEAIGSTGVGNDDAEFEAFDLPPGKFALLFQGSTQVSLPFFDGILCAAGQTKRFTPQLADPTGAALWGPGLAAAGGWAAGQTRVFQVWYRDPTGPCGTSANFSNGLKITFDP